jgi:hypothetical protein
MQLTQACLFFMTTIDRIEAFSVSWQKIKNVGLAFATIHEEPFPLPYYR